MKRLLLILAFYVLASVGVQAQVVGEEEDSSVVIWRVDKTDENGYSWEYGRCYFTPDSQFVYHQKYPAADGNIDPEAKFNLLIKRDVLTGEIVEERELFFRSAVLEISNDLQYFVAYPYPRDGVAVVYDFNTLDTITTIIFDKNEVLSDVFTDEQIERMGGKSVGSPRVSPDSKYVLVDYFFSKVEQDNQGNKFPELPHQLLCIFDIKTGEFLYEVYGTKHPGIDRHLNTIKYSSDGKYIMAWEVFYDQIQNRYDNDIRVWYVDNKYSDYRAGVNNQENINDFYYMKKSESIAISKYKPPLTIYDIKSQKIKNTYEKNDIQTTGQIATINNNENYLIFRRSGAGYSGTWLIDLINRTYYVDNSDNLNEESRRLQRIGHSAFWVPNNNIMIYYEGLINYIYAISYDPEKVITDVKSDDEMIDFLYPNPATNIVNVPVSNDTKYISISSLNGEIILKYDDIITNDGYYQIDVSRLTTGAYIVLVENESEQFAYKLIKE